MGRTSSCAQRSLLAFLGRLFGGYGDQTGVNIINITNLLNLAVFIFLGEKTEAKRCFEVALVCLLETVEQESGLQRRMQEHVTCIWEALVLIPSTAWFSIHGSRSSHQATLGVSLLPK